MFSLKKLSIAKIVFTLLGIIVILVAAFYFFRPDLFNFGIPEPWESPAASASGKTYASDTYGISFHYPDAYELMERDLVINGSPVHLVSLSPKGATGPKDGESGPEMNVTIFTNRSNTTLPAWLEQIRGGTAPPAGGYGTKEGTLGGEKAILYSATGLYESDNAAVSKRGYIYLFSVSWLTRTDAILKDFGALLSSVSFIR